MMRGTTGERSSKKKVKCVWQLFHYPAYSRWWLLVLKPFLAISFTPFSPFLLHLSCSFLLSSVPFLPESFFSLMSLVDRASRLSKWQHGTFQTWAGERESEAKRDGENRDPFHSFFFIHSVFLHNDDLNPLDFLFLTLSVCVCVSVHYVTDGNYKLLV